MSISNIEQAAFVKVTFSLPELDLLFEKMDAEKVSHDEVGGYIHNIVVKSLRRWEKRGKKGTPE